MPEPVEQAVERLHAPVEHIDVEHDDDDQQRGIEQARPNQDGVYHVTLLDGGRHHHQLKILPRLILEDGPQDTCRLGLPFLLDVDHLVGILDARVCHGKVPVHPDEVVLVVRAIVFRRKLLAAQGTDDDGLRVILQRVVHLVVDFINHRHVEEHRPHRQYQGDGNRQTECDV